MIMDGYRLVLTRTDDKETLKRILAAYTTFEK